MSNEALLEALEAIKNASHEMSVIKMVEALIEALTPVDPDPVDPAAEQPQA